MKYILFTVLIIFSSLSFAQVTAQFSAEKGCSIPYTLRPLNQSQGSGTLTYLWDFGNGETSEIGPAFTVYNTAGTFIVSLTVSNGTDTDVMTQLITVSEPTANFSVNKLKACVGDSLSFTDSSTCAGATIKSWSWYFGDGAVPSPEQNPTNAYSRSGIYTIILNVTDSNGCVTSKTENEYINVSAPPEITYSANHTFSCTEPLLVDFTSSATGTAPPYSYSWDFDNSNNSEQQDTSVSYNYGEYMVTVTVTDDNGCVNSDSSVIIKVAEITSSFTATNPDVLNDNDIICPETNVTFTDQSSGMSGNVTWLIDGTQVGAGASYVHSFDNAGTYEITHSLNINNDACVYENSMSIIVESVIADFYFENPVCDPSTAVEFHKRR